MATFQLYLLKKPYPYFVLLSSFTILSSLDDCLKTPYTQPAVENVAISLLVPMFEWRPSPFVIQRSACLPT
ncbi:hypothetical protein F4859DRAFT_496832 [Xylaria cf. heliscus]|nr:hypothetical protein F4859DRAFT_496832 [Xylaria cf. heliscus]